MKNVLIIGLLLLFCVPAFAENKKIISKIQDLDRRISMIITDERLKYEQCQEIKQIGKELDELMIPETDSEAISLYQETKQRVRDLCPY